MVVKNYMPINVSKLLPLMCKVKVKTVYYNLRAYIQDDMLHIIAVKVERVLQNNIFLDLMSLEVWYMYVTVSIPTLTAIYV